MATPRPRPASSPAPTRSTRAARCRRPAWARRWSPMASRRRAALFHPRAAARRNRVDDRLPTAASPTTCSASRRRRRPTIAPRLSGRRRRGAPPARAQPRDHRQQGRALCDAGAADGQGRSAGGRVPRLRARADRRFERRDGARSTRPCRAARRSMAPFFQRLPALRSDQKAAAVNSAFSRIPAAQLASASRRQSVRGHQHPTSASNRRSADDRRSCSIEQLAVAAPHADWRRRRRRPVAARRSRSPRRPRRTSTPREPASTRPQHARSGCSSPAARTSTALARAIRAHEVAQPRAVRRHQRLCRRRARPGAPADRSVPRTSTTPRFSPRTLQSVGIDAFTWTSQPDQTIRTLATE